MKIRSFYTAAVGNMAKGIRLLAGRITKRSLSQTDDKKQEERILKYHRRINTKHHIIF